MPGPGKIQGSTPKKLFKDLFRGRQVGSVPFLPFAFELAARVEHVTQEEIWWDPGLMVNALLNTQKLIGYDAILTRVNLTGSKNNMQVFLEATKRLKKVADRQVALACQITGPLTLARSMSDPGEAIPPAVAEDARRSVLQAVKIIGEIRPDLIIITENDIDPEMGGAEAGSAFLEPLWNTIRYYDAEPLLAAGNIGDGVLELLAGDVSGIIFLNNARGYRLKELSLLHGERGVCFGLPLPAEVYGDRYELLNDYVTEIKKHFGGGGVFACSAGEIPPDTPLEHLKTVVQFLKTCFGEVST